MDLQEFMRCRSCRFKLPSVVPQNPSAKCIAKPEAQGTLFPGCSRRPGCPGEPHTLEHIQFVHILHTYIYTEFVYAKEPVNPIGVQPQALWAHFQRDHFQRSLSMRKQRTNFFHHPSKNIFKCQGLPHAIEEICSVCLFPPRSDHRDQTLRRCSRFHLWRPKSSGIQNAQD